MVSSPKMRWDIWLTNDPNSSVRRVTLQMAESACLCFIVFPTALAMALLIDCPVIPEEACRKCVFYRFVYVLACDREEVVGVVVDNFVEDHQLYLGAGRHSKCSVFGLDELTYIGTVPVLLAVQAVIDVRLALGLGAGFWFRNLLIELDFRVVQLSVVVGPGWWIFVVAFVSSDSDTVGAALHGDGFNARIRCSGFAVVATRAG